MNTVDLILLSIRQTNTVLLLSIIGVNEIMIHGNALLYIFYKHASKEANKHASCIFNIILSWLKNKTKQAFVLLMHMLVRVKATLSPHDDSRPYFTRARKQRGKQTRIVSSM